MVRELTEDLGELHESLEAENMEASRAGFEAIHHSQHEFSKAVYLWLESEITGVELSIPGGHGH